MTRKSLTIMLAVFFLIMSARAQIYQKTDLGVQSTINAIDIEIRIILENLNVCVINIDLRVMGRLSDGIMPNESTSFIR